MKIITARTRLKNYPIYIDIKFDDFFPELIRKKFRGVEKIVLVTNNKVYDIYENKLKSALEKSGLPNEIIIIKDGEEYKDLKSVNYIFNKLINFNVHRNDLIVAFSGGVIGDLAGFAASTFHRGIKLIHCPTTIISQVDSSIGGKVGVNYNKIKNIIGSFYQPDAIIIDFDFNYTLSEDQIINGMGEVVKYGLVFEKSILDELSRNIEDKREDRLFKLIRTKAFKNIICKCCHIKTKVVKKDEFDINYRNLLNFGHTIGHCIENAFDLKKINHGKAISIGMIVAIDISISLGLLKEEVRDKIIALYKKLKLPYRLPEMDIKKIINVVKYDKKFKSSRNKFILLKGINKPFFYFNLPQSIIVENIKKSMYN